MEILWLFRPLDGIGAASMFRASPENVVAGLWAFLPPRAISEQAYPDNSVA
jgi:hypothetical protein